MKTSPILQSLCMYVYVNLELTPDDASEHCSVFKQSKILNFWKWFPILSLLLLPLLFAFYLSAQLSAWCKEKENWITWWSTFWNWTKVAPTKTICLSLHRTHRKMVPFVLRQTWQTRRHPIALCQPTALKILPRWCQHPLMKTYRHFRQFHKQLIARRRRAHSFAPE